MSKWLKLKGIKQKSIAESWNVDPGKLSHWILGRYEMGPEMRERFAELGYKGSWPREESPAVYKTLPEAAAAARQSREYLVEGNIGVVTSVGEDSAAIAQSKAISAYIAVEEINQAANPSERLSARALGRITYLTAREATREGLDEAGIRRAARELWAVAQEGRLPPESPEPD